MPIEQISPGDAVVARHQHDPADAPPQIGYVSDVHRRIVPAVLRLSLAGGGELGVTPDHEVWIEGRGWTFAGLVQPGDVLLGPAGEPLEIDGVRVDRRPTTVYNLEVEHTHTFFAEGAWVHNGRACTLGLRALRGQWHHAISKRVWRSLQEHPNLRGKYQLRDSRFTTQAIDDDTHRGYQGWHRSLDEEISTAVKRHPEWTTQEFEAHPRARYLQPDLLSRFPTGLP